MTTTNKTPPETSEAPEAPEEKPVLDFTQLAPTRRKIRLPTAREPAQGEVFELRLLDDFGIADQQALLSMSRRYEALWNSEAALDASQKTILASLLNDMLDRVLEAPKTVKRTMRDNIKARVVTAFSMAPLLTAQEQITVRVGLERMNEIDRIRNEQTAQEETELQSREDWVMKLIDEAIAQSPNGQLTTES